MWSWLLSCLFFSYAYLVDAVPPTCLSVLFLSSNQTIPPSYCRQTLEVYHHHHQNQDQSTTSRIGNSRIGRDEQGSNSPTYILPALAFRLTSTRRAFISESRVVGVSIYACLLPARVYLGIYLREKP
ncbi:hypothetical protein V8F06_007930 [Rhypophila decipiens]